jgi:hypothetical protein
LMNPPFGDASISSKDYIEEMYGDTKGNVYKTFVECFQDRLVPCGLLGIISSRAGFFLAQSTDWRKRVVLRVYRPLVLADLGHGVLDAMVETAAYVLRSISEEENRQLTLAILPELRTVPTDREGAFSIPTYQQYCRGLKRHQAIQELARVTVDEGIAPPASAAKPCVPLSRHTASHACGAGHAHRRRSCAVFSLWQYRCRNCPFAASSLPPWARARMWSTARTSPICTRYPHARHRPCGCVSRRAVRGLTAG